MPKGVRFSDDLRQAVVRMAAFQEDLTKISMYTGISVRQVRRILAEQENHPSSSDAHASDDLAEDSGEDVDTSSAKRGRPCALDDYDLMVKFLLVYILFIITTDIYYKCLEFLIQQQNDTPLDELAAELQEITGTVVSKSTIWRALEKKLGYTMKKVGILFISHCIAL